jgi:hypothetical protein
MAINLFLSSYQFGFSDKAFLANLTENYFTSSMKSVKSLILPNEKKAILSRYVEYTVFLETFAETIFRVFHEKTNFCAVIVSANFTNIISHWGKGHIYY